MPSCAKECTFTHKIVLTKCRTLDEGGNVSPLWKPEVHKPKRGALFNRLVQPKWGAALNPEGCECAKERLVCDKDRGVTHKIVLTTNCPTLGLWVERLTAGL